MGEETRGKDLNNAVSTRNDKRNRGMNDFTKYLAGRVTAGGMNRREFMGRAMAAGMTLSAAGSLFAASASAQAPKKGGTIKLGLEGGAATDSIDPAKATSQVMFCAVRTWGDTLVETHPQTRAPLPALAESWSPSPDAKIWTFKIRKGVQFHNGKEMTTDDVVATLKRHSDAKAESGALGVMKAITNIENKGGDLVVTLDSGNADLPQIFTDYHLVIQPNGGIDNPTAGIGTGAYKVTSFQPGVRMTFEKNANDWRSDRGFAQNLEFITMNDATARIAALSSGQLAP